MVLNQLKGRLKTAARGHKLLKDKRDELMRQFMDVIRLNKELRTRVEAGLTEAFGALTVASAVMSPKMLEQALMYPRQSVELGVQFKNIMSVRVPEYSFSTKTADPGEIYPYGFAQTSGELDVAMQAISSVFEDMLELARVEKTMQLLAEEIEKTRRRVNALEYVMIPEMEENIRYISMKLAENENSTKVRLMKVKDMVLQQSHDFKYPS
jgi:V/A-type H+-transporting ATPase subunit D